MRLPTSRECHDDVHGYVHVACGDNPEKRREARCDPAQHNQHLCHNVTFQTIAPLDWCSLGLPHVLDRQPRDSRLFGLVPSTDGELSLHSCCSCERWLSSCAKIANPPPSYVQVRDRAGEGQGGFIRHPEAFVWLVTNLGDWDHSRFHTNTGRPLTRWAQCTRYRASQSRRVEVGHIPSPTRVCYSTVTLRIIPASDVLIHTHQAVGRRLRCGLAVTSKKGLSVARSSGRLRSSISLDGPHPDG